MLHWYLHVFRGSYSLKTRSERKGFSLTSFRIKEKPCPLYKCVISLLIIGCNLKP